MFIQAVNFATPSYGATAIQQRRSQLNYSVTNSALSFKGDNIPKIPEFDYEAVKQKELDKRTKIEKLCSWGKTAAEERAKQQLIGFHTSVQSLILQKEQTIQAHKKVLQEKEKAVAALKDAKRLLEEKLKDAEANHEKDIVIIELRAELEATKKLEAQKTNDLALDKAKFERIKQEQENISRRDKDKGWNKVAGYENLKQEIEEGFLNKFAIEKAGDDVVMPNGILLYGPSGTGKTYFANALAEQAKCHFEKIDTLQDDDDIIADLRKTLRNAKKNYNQDNKRTIVLLDDFNSIAELTDEDKAELAQDGMDISYTNVGQLSNILQNCADKFKTTILMTTNFPRRIDKEVMTANNIPHQIFLGPPQTEDLAAMFEYHLDGVTDQDIDYEKLAKVVSKAQEDNEAYSAQGVVNIINKAKANCPNSKITEPDLLKAIKQTPPDITKAQYAKFIDDLDAIVNKN
ncbi:MAG: ATP-binding protein [Cyanobacteria bacterium SIG26]|nr:ATP-binding protein [Cyanobacteria bacterium SIG26]